MMYFEKRICLFFTLVLFSFLLQSCATTPDRTVSSSDGLKQLPLAQMVLDASKEEDLEALKNIFHRSNNWEVRQEAEALGSILNYQDADGMTAIMYLARSGNSEITNYLLKRHYARGAKLKFNFRKPVYDLPFSMESEHDKTSTLTNNEGDTALHLASRNGHSRVVHLLINDFKVFVEQEGMRPFYAIVGINAQNNLRRTPLMEAVIAGHVRVVKQISQWSNVNVQDEDGMTAIMHAAQRPDELLEDREKTVEIIKLIQDRSFINREAKATSFPKIDLKNKDGQSVIDITAKKHEDIINAVSQ